MNKIRSFRTRGCMAVVVGFLFPCFALGTPMFSFVSEVRHNDNLSRTDQRWSGEKEADTGLFSAVRAESGRVLEGDFRLATGLEVGSEMWWSTSGFNNVRPKADVALTRRFGLGPTAPYLRAELGGGRAFYEESFRDGWFWETGLAGGKHLSERLAVEVGYRFEENGARDRFFRSDGHTFFTEATWFAAPRLPVFGGYSFRRGIIHSYTMGEKMDLPLSRRGMQETFDDLNWVYRTRLNSHVLSIGVAPELTEHASLLLSYAFQHSRGSGFRYNNNLISAGLVFFF